MVETETRIMVSMRAVCIILKRYFVLYFKRLSTKYAAIGRAVKDVINFA